MSISRARNMSELQFIYGYNAYCYIRVVRYCICENYASCVLFSCTWRSRCRSAGRPRHRGSQAPRLNIQPLLLFFFLLLYLISIPSQQIGTKLVMGFHFIEFFPCPFFLNFVSSSIAIILLFYLNIYNFTV